MSNLLVRKLEQFVRFTPRERACLDEIEARRHRPYAAGETIFAEGQKPDFVHLVISGLAARSKLLSNGRRQIMAFVIPGDLCDSEVFVLEKMDHDLVALTDTVCAHISLAEIEPLLREVSSLARALWWSTMTDSAVLRERIIDFGGRDAGERICHMLYELLIRYRMVGLAEKNSFPFPITQEQLAEATGLTPVHVNRVIAGLRAEGLIEWKHKIVSIPDLQRLKQAGRFEGGYLHLGRTAQGDRDVSVRAGDLL